ncbi:hypothetical protein DX928_17510 [Bacillus swezeyi]|uniref:Uncharacterized protein n=1 Tax=Bacillus swezeyi TaxID=1925020 RepID=A0A5M8RPY7_9BACI|nr:hypothetical protein DX927_17195 [Bacillus swezeyi]KAA6474371.1 hypothetical protein DX928_17510 [Bacillus swezeyi]
MEISILNFLVIVISAFLIIFIARSKGINNKIDLILVLIGAALIFLIDNQYVWVSVWILLIVYFLVKYTKK